jgi:hypothetical protein
MACINKWEVPGDRWSVEDLGWLFLDGVEAELFGGDGIGGDELFDGVEDDLEILVVFLFEALDLFGEQFVRLHQGAELDEGAHDRDVDLDGAGERRTEESMAMPCSVKA